MEDQVREVQQSWISRKSTCSRCGCRPDGQPDGRPNGYPNGHPDGRPDGRPADPLDDQVREKTFMFSFWYEEVTLASSVKLFRI